jgi:hypothetical protein
MSALVEVLRNERSLWREQLGDRPRDVGLNIAALLFAAVFVPWMAGLAFLDPLVVLLFACLSAFFVANLTPRAFAEDRAFAGLDGLRARGATEAAIVAGKCLATALTGWVFGLVILACAIVSVNAMHWHGKLLLPSARILAAAAALSLAASCAVAGAAALVSLRGDSLYSSQRTVRWSILIAMFGLIFGYQYLPGSWAALLEGDLSDAGVARKAWISTVALFVLAAALWRAAVLRFTTRATQLPGAPL